MAREELLDLIAANDLAPAATVRAARTAADREDRSFVEVLVEQGVAEETLADVVARAIGSVVVDVEGGTLDGDAVLLLPERIARRYLVIVVAPDPASDSLRVAFADPLDDDAVRVVREHTGLGVTQLVATVSGVRAAIDREYRPPNTRVSPRAPRSDLASESTRRVEVRVPAPHETSPGARPDTLLPDEPAGGTSPVHRIEQEATIEQRHEALVLALVEAGVITRSDYTSVLRRMLRRQ